MDYVIGCDVGTQSTKAVLLSLEGALAGEASASYGVDYPQPLWAEQPVERWIDALTQAIRRLLHETGVGPAHIRALALATQVDGVVALGQSGRPLHPAIIWMDRRAATQCAAARRIMDDKEVFRRTGLNLDPSHVAPKICWLAEHKPAIAEQVAYFLLPGSYLAWYLTSELAVDYSNASSTLLLDVRARSWSNEMCSLFGVEPARLAPLGAATARLGTLRPTVARTLGLRGDTMVVIGSGDEHAACLGAGVTPSAPGPGLACDIAGTAEPVCAASIQPLFDDTQLVETHCHADPDFWLLENPGFVSGGNYRWFRDHFATDIARPKRRPGSRAYALLDNEAAAVPPGADGLTFLPCLMGAMTPTWNEAARGTFSGFTLAHTRGHFARAILEGSAFAVRDIIDRMQASGLALHELRVVGGGARSPLWNQIKADVTGLTVAVPRTTETTALGAALLALVGSGAFHSLAEASQRAVHIHQRFEPQPAAQDAYSEAYERYRATYFTQLPLFERIAKH